MEIDERPVIAEEPPALLDGRYRLGEVLGRGGVATVYAALDVRLGRDVAVKLFRPGGRRTGLYRFAAEARLLAGLSHPGLVTVYDVQLDGDRPYLVMQRITGHSLGELLDRGPLPAAATARLGARIASVLAHIHARDVVHRDIKPSNVLVDWDGDFYLADFGIARAMGAAHFTTSGELIGTVAYLAPEQVTDVDTGPPADVYALGLVLLECLTGEVEYTGVTVQALVARLSRPPRVPAGLPSPWQAVLTAMTARDPVARPTAARCADMLEAVAENRTVQVPSPPHHTAPHRTAPHRTARHAGLVAAALAGAVAVGIAVVPSAVPGSPTGDSPVDPPSASTEPAQPTSPAERLPPPEPAGRPPEQPMAPAADPVPPASGQGASAPATSAPAATQQEGRPAKVKPSRANGPKPRRP